MTLKPLLDKLTPFLPDYDSTVIRSLVTITAAVISQRSVNLNKLKGVIGSIAGRRATKPSSLYVEHGILTEKVKVAVENSSAWADFVFDTNYELLPIEEVAFFVDENQHLPDVPSADEMVEDGLDVAQMDALLLQKIEELTLYIRVV